MTFKKKKLKLFPFVWPWCDENGDKRSIKDVIRSRVFSVGYLIISWSIVVILDYAVTRMCHISWQASLQCDYAFWIKNLAEAPLIFFRNLFSTPFIHNGPDHILFVSIIGLLIFVQSFEVIFGLKKTALIFFSAYLIVAPIYAAVYTIGIEIYPESNFLEYVFGRNWSGGSLGMFQVYGALAIRSRKPLLILFLPVLFELFNLLVIGIHLQISLMHVTCTFVGYGLSLWLIKK